VDVMILNTFMYKGLSEQSMHVDNLRHARLTNKIDFF
jgi:hypothetical protein